LQGASVSRKSRALDPEPDFITVVVALIRRNRAVYPDWWMIQFGFLK
jgi:hypothetical protein